MMVAFRVFIVGKTIIASALLRLADDDLDLCRRVVPFKLRRLIIEASRLITNNGVIPPPLCRSSPVRN